MIFNWKIGGEAGFGIMTSGLTFSKVATRSGYHIFDYAEYPSLIRGGHNTYEVAFSEDPVHAPLEHIDLLVCLNKETYTLHKDRLSASSLLLYDPEMFTPDGPEEKIPVPFTQIKKDEQIQTQMINSVAVAASVALLGGDKEILAQMIHEQFDRKGEEVVKFNLHLATIGYDHIEKAGGAKKQVLAHRPEVPKRLVMTGNEMFSLACVPADCRHYASYPMTPASTVLGILAAWQYKNGMVVRHPEDEIAAINSALGSSFAGARSAVGTSGGGFALMVEALSFAGVAEIPVVVFLSMRPGPATGLPTWTEQGDLLFAVHAGHGEYPKIVLAPGDIDEMAELTLKGFDLADIYQTPVIILSDKFLSESHKDIEKSSVDALFSSYTPNRGKIVTSPSVEPYHRFAPAQDGISPMLLPGHPGVFYQANSYEHLADSHTTEDASVRIEQVQKRNKKIETYYANHFQLPQTFGDILEAHTVLVTWGTTKASVLEALKHLDAGYACAHFTHVYPMPQDPVVKWFAGLAGKRIVLVENNSQAQFGQLLRMQTGVDISEKILKYDGRPIFPEEIVRYFQKDTKEGAHPKRSPQGVIAKLAQHIKKTS